MATYDIGAIRAALKTLLASVATVGIVYDYMNPTIASFPAVIFDVDNESSAFLDDVSNLRVLSFKIWVACEITTQGLDATKTLLDTVSKDVIIALEKKSNMTLSGTADWIMPVVGKRDQGNGPEGQFIYQELTLQVNVASTIL